MSFDINSYLMGMEDGPGGNVTIEGGINCTDPNSDGNIIIEEVE